MHYPSSERSESRSHRVKTIYLVRHGAISSRYKGRFIGRTDVPLSSKGRRQAARLTQLLKRCPELACVTSPLRRSRATARLAVPEMNGSMRVWPDLREMDFGRWEGLTFNEIWRRDPKQVDRWARFSPEFRFPGGEGLRPFQTRLRRLERRLLRHPAKELLAVSHGGVIRSLLCVWSGKPLHRYPEFQVRPGSLSVVRVRNGKPRIVSVDVMS